MYSLKSCELFDLSHTAARALLSACEYPWQALPKIKDFITELIKALPTEEYYTPSDNVRVSKRATVAKSAIICGPAVIGAGSEIRHGAYIRGSALVGEGCIIGNSCELKNAIIFDGAQIPHFNYVGDSVVGYRAHMGAGAITSNVKSDKTPISIRSGSEFIETGLLKLGAMIGDFAEIGSGCVLNPGTVIGRNSNIYPLSSVRGSIPKNSIFKAPGEIVPKH